MVFILHGDFSHDLTALDKESLQSNVLTTLDIWLGIGHNLSEVNSFLLFETEMFVTLVI